MIYIFEFLGLIDKPNWAEYARKFDESSFEIYLTRALVEVENDNISALIYDLKAKLVISEALKQV